MSADSTLRFTKSGRLILPSVALDEMIIIYRGEKYRCTRAVMTDVEFEHVLDGKLLQLTHEKFNSLVRSGDIKIRNRRPARGRTSAILEMPQSLADLTAREMDEHQKTMKYVQNCLELPGTRRVIRAKVKQLAKSIGDADPPSPTKILRWRKEFQEKGHCIAIVAGRRLSGRRDPRVHERAYKETRDYCRNTTGADRKSKFPQGRKFISTALKDVNKKLKPVGVAVSAKFIKEMRACMYSQIDIEQAKNGLAAARSKYQARGDGRYGDFTNQSWQADHTIIDLRALLSYNKSLEGNPIILTIRLTLTVIVESRSGIVLGFYLGTKPASQYTLQQALLMALLPKDELFKSLEFPGSPLPLYGKPEEFVVDQALEAVAAGFMDILSGHGIKIVRLEGRRPDLKGTVESLFNTTNKQVFHTLDGAAVNHRDRSITSEQAQALHTIKGLNRILAHFFFVELPHERNSHTSRTRLQMWNDGLSGPTITPKIDQDYLLTMLLTKVPRPPKIGAHGIRLHHRDYDSEAFCAYRNEAEIHGTECAAVYYVPGDLSRVYIKITPKSELLLLRSAYMELDEGICVDAYLETRREVSKLGENDSEAEIVAAAVQSAALVAEDRKAGASIRQKAAGRLLGGESEEVAGLMKIPGVESAETNSCTSPLRITPHQNSGDVVDVDEDYVNAARSQFEL